MHTSVESKRNRLRSPFRSARRPNQGESKATATWDRATARDQSAVPDMAFSAIASVKYVANTKVTTSVVNAELAKSYVAHAATVPRGCFVSEVMRLSKRWHVLLRRTGRFPLPCCSNARKHAPFREVTLHGVKQRVPGQGYGDMHGLLPKT